SSFAIRCDEDPEHFSFADFDHPEVIGRLPDAQTNFADGAGEVVGMQGSCVVAVEAELEHVRVEAGGRVRFGHRILVAQIAEGAGKAGTSLAKTQFIAKEPVQ